MSEFLFGISIILVCILCEGFFSGTETAIVSVDHARIKALAERGAKKEAWLHSFLRSPERFFSVTLLGTNIFVVLSNSIATVLVIEYLGEQYKYVTILIMTPLILIFGEIVPKTVYRYHAEKITPYLIYPFRVIAVIFYPFVTLLAWITKLFVKLFGMESARFVPHTTREDLENYVGMWNINNRLRTAEKKIIARIFDFSKTDVEDIMKQLVNIETLEINESIDKAVSLAQKTGYSRLPVYSEEAYNITGIVHAFDLLTAQSEAKTLKDRLKP